jgi:trk system potassium uptake protein TrkH
VLGAIAMKLCPGINKESALSWTDSFFMSTSAVCVTGLSVVDTTAQFTLLGQILLLILIQLGGLGMLVLTSVMITALGGRPSLRTESMAASTSHLLPQIPARNLIKHVVGFTLVSEFVGAAILYLLWAPQMGWAEAMWPAIFHSISAFCNAGFSTNSSSLTFLQGSPIALSVISALIIAGGLGFITVEELYQRYVISNKKIRRLSIHTKLVVISNAILFLGVWPIFAFFEWNNVLDAMPAVDKLSNSFFMGVTPRTAGFNTVNYADATDSTILLTMILMMIGGSPGSTAGGLKTTTVAVLLLLAWSRLRSHPTCTFGNRSIPEGTLQRAAGIFVIGTGIVIVGVFALVSIGDIHGKGHQLLIKMFEVISAFNTVGLSMGITAELSTPSRWILILLMFVGRTGPLVLAAALVVHLSAGGKYRLAYEDIAVG